MAMHANTPFQVCDASDITRICMAASGLELAFLYTSLLQWRDVCSSMHPTYYRVTLVDVHECMTDEAD